MAGTTVSFVADLKLAERVREIARSDGVTQSQAAARASALGALLPTAARRALRFLMEQGGEDAQTQLATEIAKAIGRVSNRVLGEQLLLRAQQLGLDTKAATQDDLANEAVKAVADYYREQGASLLSNGHHDPSR
jgi:predicted DsbA family dithiol-disulfide isomerase